MYTVLYPLRDPVLCSYNLHIVCFVSERREDGIPPCFAGVGWKRERNVEYFQAMVAMDLEGKIRRPRTEFDDERVRYEHRFAPLGQVSTPPLVPYVQFKEMTKVRS